jgi:hypothetical protein
MIGPICNAWPAERVVYERYLFIDETWASINVARLLLRSSAHSCLGGFPVVRLEALRAKICRQGRAGMDRRSWREDGLHHAGRPFAGRVLRELQLETSRRTAERRNLLLSLKIMGFVIGSLRRHYNSVRPLASWCYKPPTPEVLLPAIAARAAAQSKPAPAPRPCLLRGRRHINIVTGNRRWRLVSGKQRLPRITLLAWNSIDLYDLPSYRVGSMAEKYARWGGLLALSNVASHGRAHTMG